MQMSLLIGKKERQAEMALFGGRKRKQRLEEAGVNAQAVLVSFREVGQQNFTPLVDLTLRITPVDGTGPFDVTVRTQVEFSQIGNLKLGDAFTVRYDPNGHDNCELGEKINSARATGAGESLESASAGAIAAAVQATGDTGQRKSAADLLASGQRMTAVLREFSASGKTVGDLNPALPDPNDPVYVIKVELPIDVSSPIESAFMNRVPEAKVASLRLGAHLNVAVNPANNGLLHERPLRQRCGYALPGIPQKRGSACPKSPWRTAMLRRRSLMRGRAPHGLKPRFAAIPAAIAFSPAIDRPARCISATTSGRC
jgi:hypothetical protein